MPIASVRRWLRDLDTNASDLEGVPADAVEEDGRKDRQRKPIVIWTSKGAEFVDDGKVIRPGQTIVVPVSYGGADEYGWNPGATPQDIFDEVNDDEAERGLRKRIVRLDVVGKGQEAVEKLIKTWCDDHDPEVCSEILAALALNEPKGRIDLTGRIVTWPKNPAKRKGEPAIEPLTEEYDETDDNSFTKERTLKQHTDGVVEHARRYARGCGLSGNLVDNIVLAARLHDLGKCDERFQAWLAGKPFAGGEYLAKSSEDRTIVESRKLRKLAEYPEGARHEAASVVAACASGLLAQAHNPELVLHLIGTHHGWGRPWFPVWEDEPGFRVVVEAENQKFACSDGLELARMDSGWVDRFTSLNRRYGYWGLAFLEAILRRADCMQSRKEAESAAN